MNLSGGAAMVVIIAILFVALLILISPWLIALALLRRQAMRFMNERVNTVVAQYDPPYGFTPAEIGLLYDMRCNNKEIWATLLDLQRRGIISIAADGVVTLSALSAFDNLPPYEQTAIRMYDKQAQTIGELKTVHVATLVTRGVEQPIILKLPPTKSTAAFTAAVRESLAAKGYPTHSYWKAFFLRVLIIAFIVSFWPLAFAASGGNDNGHAYAAWSARALGASIGIAALFDLFLWPAYVLAGFVGMQLWVRFAGRSWLNTRQIRQLWPELEGYRLFLKTVDLAAIQTEAGTDAPDRSMVATLPYAIALNLDTKWQQRLSK